MKFRIFISSVQSEFAEERRMLKGYYTKHIERLGTGLTDLIDACRDAGLAEPLIEMDGSIYYITIFRKWIGHGDVRDGVNQGVNQGVKEGAFNSELMSLIAANPGRRSPFFAEVTGKTVKSIEYELQLLRQTTPPKIEFRGAPKTGGYYVLAQKGGAQ